MRAYQALAWRPAQRLKKGPGHKGPATSGTLREEEYITITSKL